MQTARLTFENIKLYYCVEDGWEILRERMVNEQIIGRGIKDERLIQAMLKVPRHRFVGENLRTQAYNDYPLPIGSGQTISQPYMVALMTELMGLRGQEKVLEIGTGSGYQTAILAELSEQVFTIERISELSLLARQRIESLGYSNVVFRVGDGTIGWPEYSPYARILVTAGAPDVPKSLFEQLADGGIMVLPIGDRSYQVLNVVKNDGGQPRVVQSAECTFVPLLGKEGWSGA
ncbi:MAG TPA: protein-L-isoaspartate(D-aspartate) O-methyltransferase [bacterium (Candidatus Stahlbacteria)]|nr:protein-L-isoaspartate(D-aspartate) O-methyltransferase [Candidatus Stahlbacteria bacterium]